MSDSERYRQFVDLLQLHSGRILSYIRVLLLNWSDADDLFQETCLVLWQRFGEFEPNTNFVAWALRIAEYKAMDFQKKRSRQAAFSVDLQSVLRAEIAKRSEAAETDDLTALSRCMDRLAPNDRKAVTLCYGERVPVRRVADALGRSPESVHRSLRRIRKWLLDCIHRKMRESETPLPLVPPQMLDREDTQ
jgi:RNA polymerase sigma-70 factor, ECF subfamily